jgi:GxxExxY protein
MVADQTNELSGKVIGAAIEVHKALGPGLLESAYEECLCDELGLRRIVFQRQVVLPVLYKGVKLDCGYVQDIVVDDRIIVELKAVEQVTALHKAQLLTYLRLSDRWLGLLINFNVPVLINGIERIVNGAPR